MYDKIMIMNQRGSNPEYKKLLNVLSAFQSQGNQGKVVPIHRENDIKNHGNNKSLIVL